MTLSATPGAPPDRATHVDGTGHPHGGHPVPDRIRAWSALQPDHPAIVDGAVTVTYGDLVAQAERVASRLREHGVGPDALVGLCLDRSPELVAAALGTLLAGGAYVGLDVHEPATRLAAILAEARPLVVVTRAERADQSAPPGATVLTVDDLLGTPGGTLPPVTPDPDDACYVTYTSGSTGIPRGVLVPHAGVTNLVGWYAETFTVTPADRMPQLARPSFDGWGLEVWPALANGATLCLMPSRLPESPGRFVDWLCRERITICFLTTALAAELFAESWDRPDVALRTMLVGGEKLHRYPPADLPFETFNVYGPTETTMLATCGLMDRGAPREEAPPIGRPLANMRAYVLDADDRPVPDGQVGELHIGGVGVGRGYLGHEALTARRFRPDPFSDVPDARRYATGDLVRRRPDGQLDFVGRVDDQVKLRGFRIEPGEIETALQRHPAVRTAVVVVVTTNASGGDAASDGSRLVGYVVPSDGPVDLSEVRAYAAEVLPQFMVPHVLLEVESFPLTPHGKVDRPALAARPLPAGGRNGGAPRGHLEQQLAELWCAVLEVDEVGREDDFFELGGDSLLAMRLAARARERGIKLGAEDLFEHEILHELAAAISGEAR